MSALVSKASRIYVAGHTGMVGSAIVRRLRQDGYTELILRTRAELDLCNQQAVHQFLKWTYPEYIIDAAALAGGIRANMQRPADFITANLIIQTNLIQAAHQSGACRRFLFLGSSCIYPQHAPIPIGEDRLLTGPLEPTNAPYAVAKIAGITMLEAYRAQHGMDSVTLMPCNLYGPNDSYGPTAHVIPALLERFRKARQHGERTVTIWGTGQPLREFLHVDDLARAAVIAMTAPAPAPILNVGAGDDLPIVELARLIRDIVGYEGMILFDPKQPDGVPRKLLDSSAMRALGWAPTIGLRQGLEQVYRAAVA